jgi:translation initiation factor 3 subunit M
LSRLLLEHALTSRTRLQIIEAVTLIARSRPENVRVSYISQFAAAAKAAAPTPEVVDDDDGGEGEDREKKEAEEESEETKEAKRKVVKDMLSSIKGLRLEGTDKEFEGFANLILSLILSLFASSHPDFPTLILILSDALSFSADRSANPTLSARYSSLATIFNSLPSPATNALRLTVLLKLISYASSNDDFSVIQPALARLESWLVEWGFGPGTSGEEEGNAAIATVVSSLLAKSRLAEARTLLLAHLSSPSAVSGTSTTPSSSTAKLASQLIGLSLALPTVFDFSSLSTLPAVASPSVPTLATLLSMFQTGDVAAFEQFAKENQAVLDEQKLDAGALERKLRLLALAELCSKRVGELVSYEEIATALRLQADAGDDGEEVETWVIDGTSDFPTKGSGCTRRRKLTSLAFNSDPRLAHLWPSLPIPPLFPCDSRRPPRFHRLALDPTREPPPRLAYLSRRHPRQRGQGRSDRRRTRTGRGGGWQE